jgi:ERCC4-type nuclease
MHVKIDSAEHKDMDKLFRHHSVTTERVQLQFGDYWLYDGDRLSLIITFKTVNDYVRSYQTGHIMDELAELYEKSPVPFALVVSEGGFIYGNNLQFFEKTRNVMNMRVPLFVFSNRSYAVRFMVRMAGRNNIGDIRRKVNIERSVEPVIATYMTLPGVGLKTAKKLYNRYKTPYELIMATSNDGWNKGILGDKTAEKVMRYVRGGISPERKVRGIDVNV